MTRVADHVAKKNSKSVCEMKAAIVYHYVLTVLCIAVCITDYAINVHFMHSYLKLMAVAVDSSVVTLCNFCMVNDKVCSLARLSRLCQGTGSARGTRVPAAAAATEQLASIDS